jgi:hypothetical protein
VQSEILRIGLEPRDNPTIAISRHYRCRILTGCSLCFPYDLPPLPS